MSKLNYKKVMPRYLVIAIAMTLVAICVVGKALYTMTIDKGYWAGADSTLRTDKKSPAVRGNILSCDGQLMASSLPEYKVFIDFETLISTKADTAVADSIDYICRGLNEIFPEKSAADFKKELGKKLEKELRDTTSTDRRRWPLWDKRIDYNTRCEIQELPVFKRGKYKSGVYFVELSSRQRPFGSLASRTVGDLYKDNGKPRCGLEMSYDSILRGTEGIVQRRKVRNKFLSFTQKPTIDGADIVTTIDINMQDLAERALLEELRQPDVKGDIGVAIVMEVETGDIKAMVNMMKDKDGEYRELGNFAVSAPVEPGSVFKTASMMVILDDGYVDTTYTVDTGGGVYNMYGRDMKDHNWLRGGYGVLTLPWSLKYSSNIGISRIIDKYYHNQPEKFVQGIYDLGLTTDYKLNIPGYVPAKVRMPKKTQRGQYTNWYKTTLPWMSIGYETAVPPIATVAFYNAIANNGKLMRPRIVKSVVKDGQVIEEFPPEVVKERIAKPQTITWIQRILREVVSEGLAKPAGSDKFGVAGKTGTAQVAKGKQGYKAGGIDYLVSFAGFFPYEKPRYSCIVCIQKHGLPASGGGMSGVVFRQIAEGIMAQSLKVSAAEARDSSSILIPKVKSGNLYAGDYVLNWLGFDVIGGWKGGFKFGDPVWGSVDDSTSKQRLTLVKTTEPPKSIVPDVHGMGARDAVYLLESRGVKTRLRGRGKVTKQSIAPGDRIRRGMVCHLELG